MARSRQRGAPAPSAPQAQEVWFVEDTSTNGTFVNDVRVVKGQRHPICCGDVLRLSTPPVDVVE
jgi:predicted component of type VI protein secretion system